MPLRAPVAILLGLLLCFAQSAARADGPASPELPRELQVIDRVVGQGKEVRPGVFVALHYTGYVYDPAAPEGKGRQFVSSRERGETWSYKYGVTRAIPGFEKGLRGMRAGGSRTIVVPAKLGYDGRKYPTPNDVPPKSALVFDVELIDVVPESAE